MTTTKSTDLTYLPMNAPVLSQPETNASADANVTEVASTNEADMPKPATTRTASTDMLGMWVVILIQLGVFVYLYNMLK